MPVTTVEYGVGDIEHWNIDFSVRGAHADDIAEVLRNNTIGTHSWYVREDGVNFEVNVEGNHALATDTRRKISAIVEKAFPDAEVDADLYGKITTWVMV